MSLSLSDTAQDLLAIRRMSTSLFPADGSRGVQDRGIQPAAVLESPKELQLYSPEGLIDPLPVPRGLHSNRPREEISQSATPLLADL